MVETTKDGNPFRYPIKWDEPQFTDPAQLENELRRVFDICHTCRRCINLCDAFPRLFDLIDESNSGELDTVKSEGFAHVVDACTLCDMCFMVSCPYVPPHEWNIDFPHLMLRYKTYQYETEKINFSKKQLVQIDRNAKFAQKAPKIVNWATKKENKITRPIMEKIVDINRSAELPKFQNKTFLMKSKSIEKNINNDAPNFGKKVVLYTTCYVNYNDHNVGLATQAVLQKNGVDTEIIYPQCCGMPLYEQGNLKAVSEHAIHVSSELMSWIDKGYDIIALVPSCALMLKFEWPLLLPNNENIKKLAHHTHDISEYIVKLSKDSGLADGLQSLTDDYILHLACHSRAQNIGRKAYEMLKLIPNFEIDVIDRCSGHGGSWGIMKDNFPVALKVGKPVVRKINEKKSSCVLSECPLAGIHIKQGIDELNPDKTIQQKHPIEILAIAYGLSYNQEMT